MALKEKLMADFKEAMKSHDEVGKNTITLIRAAVKQAEVDTRTELSDEEIIAIIAKQIKMRKEAIKDFEKGGREDLVQAYKAEIEILSAYMPPQISEEEIRKIVRDTASELGIEGGRENMGKLMGRVMQNVKGTADGGDVRKIVQEFLA